MSDHNSKKWESDTDRESTPNKLPSRPRREDRQLSDNDQEESASSPENPFIYDEDEAIVGTFPNPFFLLYQGLKTNITP